MCYCSMMAVRAGAKRVYACEVSSVMIELSQLIYTANDIKDSIIPMHSLSTDIQSLPEK